MRQPTQFASGLVVHLAFAVLFAWILAGPPLTPAPAPRGAKALVWTSRPGWSGGGGGGDRTKASAAPRRRVVPPTAQFTSRQAPAVLRALELPGAVAVLSVAAPEGTGIDDGLGKGRGEGLEGPGSGPRTGPGAGPGDGAFQDGAPGVTPPQLLYERTPEYTAGAMLAKVEGTVLLEATVLSDGSVGRVRVARSLGDAGLDQKAVEAVRGWRFRPGTYFGQPAAVKVLIELTFSLR